MPDKRLFEVVHEDDELLVVNKPAGLACHPTKGDAWSSLISRVRLHLGEGIRPHLVNRLDRETSGIVLVAKQDDVARELRRIWEQRLVTKEYLAIVHGRMPGGAGLIDAALGCDESSEIAIKDCVRPDGSPAVTAYQPLELFYVGDEAFTLVKVKPSTGRKHQIRIHLQHIGYPIVGDKMYGVVPGAYLALVQGRLSREQQARLILENQALHAERVTYVFGGRERRFSAVPSVEFSEFVRRGGVDWPLQTGVGTVDIGEEGEN